MKTHPTSPAASDLRRILGREKILDDFSALTAYSADASIYRIPPTAVVLIQSESDLKKVIHYARPRGIPLTARSGGTNLCGNAIGEGLILDFSRLNRILEINREEKWVRVQPGKIYAELNRDLEHHGLFFPPDPSSGEVCKIGGMLGNNSAGPHSLKYGATKDNVHEMRMITSAGAPLSARPYRFDEPDFHTLLRNEDPVRALYSLLKTNQGLLLNKQVRVSKNSSGYNLFDMARLLDQEIFDLTRLFTGSEGTLAFLSEATLKLRDKPDRKATALVYFDRMEEVGEAVNRLNPLRPGALELMDSSSLDLIGREAFGVPPRADAMLLVEFDEEPIGDRINQAREILRNFQLSRPVEIARDAEHEAALWKVRRAIYPKLYGLDSRRRPINFVDDVVVPASRLPELTRYLKEYFEAADIPVAVYGHIGDGNAHINPLMDLKDPAEFEKLAVISRDIHTTVIEKFGGSICGEHGDGRVRGEFLRKLYGDEVYELFRTVKNAFDPDQILNPGVKLTVEPFTSHIDIDRISGNCASCGKCNTVCPVYDVLEEESNGARGWLRIVTSSSFTHETAGRSVDACLNCKSCLAVCPTGIDVSSHILEKRAERPDRLTGLIFRVQARTRIFETLLKTAALLQPYWNRPLGRRLLDRVTRPFLRGLGASARISPAIAIPELSTRTLRERHRGLTEEGGAEGGIAYFHGCAANYFKDGVGDALIELMKKTGNPVVLPEQRCSGTPIETYGHRDLTIENARFNMRSLNRFEKVVTGCASCTFMLRDYARFFQNESEKTQAGELARKVFHLAEHLDQTGFKVPEGGSDESGDGRKKMTYHSSCHLRAAGVTREPRDLIKNLPGVEYTEMRDAERCAGGAGTYLVRNFERSEKIFARKRKGILESKAETVATSCPACMIRLRTGLSERIQVKHIAQVLNDALPPGPQKAPESPLRGLPSF